MADQDPLTADPVDPPAWDFPDRGNLPPEKEFVSRADLAEFGRQIVEQVRGPARDISKVEDPNIAAILEAMEKNPEQGLKMHSAHIAGEVTKEVVKSMTQMQQQMRVEAEVPALREQLIAKICRNSDGTTLNDGAKDFLREYAQGFGPDALRNILAGSPDLKVMRMAAVEAHRATATAGTKPAGTGGTGGTGGPPTGSGLSNEDEADAQKLFEVNKGVKGYTIEMARATVKNPMDDRSVVLQKNPDWQVK